MPPPVASLPGWKTDGRRRAWRLRHSRHFRPSTGWSADARSASEQDRLPDRGVGLLLVVFVVVAAAVVASIVVMVVMVVIIMLPVSRLPFGGASAANTDASIIPHDPPTPASGSSSSTPWRRLRDVAETVTAASMRDRLVVRGVSGRTMVGAGEADAEA